jgi:hypothetical protein
MDLFNPIPQVSYALQKSLGLWFMFWAIRFKAGVDYRLSARGRAIRWGVVFTAFALTAIPGASLGWFRVSAFLVGLGFLCWPNLAYYMGRSFETWHETEGRVGSIQRHSASCLQVAYDFEVDGSRYGGQRNLKVDPRLDVSQDRPEQMRVVVSYDPLNPGRSSRIRQKSGVRELSRSG